MRAMAHVRPPRTRTRPRNPNAAGVSQEVKRSAAGGQDECCSEREILRNSMNALLRLERCRRGLVDRPLEFLDAGFRVPPCSLHFAEPGT